MRSGTSTAGGEHGLALNLAGLAHAGGIPPRVPAGSSPRLSPRIDPATGERELVIDAYCGRPLNSPNGVVVKSDGELQEPREVAPGELRAPSVEGGDRRELRKAM